MPSPGYCEKGFSAVVRTCGAPKSTTIMTNLLTAASLVFLTASAPAPAPSQSTPQPQAEAPAQPRTSAQSRTSPTLQAIAVLIRHSPTSPSSACRPRCKLPRFTSAFRVTHRFGRPLGDGSFGDLGETSSASIRAPRSASSTALGILAGTQIGIHRTSNHTIEFFTQHDVLGKDRLPVGLDMTAIRRRHRELHRELLPGVWER